MDRFQALTGLPYDKVMVFPHSIGPEGALAALKEYNYIATVNSWNVPMDRPNPTSLSFALRPVTVLYENFPSIARSSAEVPISRSFIAMDAFLDNPLLFYGHHGLFARSIGAFNSVADAVNQIEPGIRWRSLGDIAKHLYLMKLRDDSDYEVLAFSSTITLNNTSGRDSTFYVRKQETGRPAIKSVKVDGREYNYRLLDNYLTLKIAVASGRNRSVAIEYENDLAGTPISISRDSARVYFLRMASDFRDITLSKSGLGQTFVRFYHDYDLTPKEVSAFVLAVTAACLWAAWWLCRVVRKSFRTEGHVQTLQAKYGNRG
jgi:hypothetical protein